ncbi:hypothetical protein GN244_ATG20827 [Phytophthora infestans]|uniref:Uncharacterized protein n=1 Tax=Phytophthora infestans TaxID=4787 RepID=A0A833SF47_PHYIN|nr:hypothetical protein GN244_ATG20827 [Phytophthora infestans]
MFAGLCNFTFAPSRQMPTSAAFHGYEARTQLQISKPPVHRIGALVEVVAPAIELDTTRQITSTITSPLSMEKTANAAAIRARTTFKEHTRDERKQHGSSRDEATVAHLADRSGLTLSGLDRDVLTMGSKSTTGGAQANSRCIVQAAGGTGWVVLLQYLTLPLMK